MTKSTDSNHLLANLGRGSVVRALHDMDPDGAHVEQGDLGVVFQESDYHSVGTGPMVRWIVGHAAVNTRPDQSVYASHEEGGGGVCNVYDGDVEIVDLVERSDEPRCVFKLPMIYRVWIKGAWPKSGRDVKTDEGPAMAAEKFGKELGSRNYGDDFSRTVWVAPYAKMDEGYDYDARMLYSVEISWSSYAEAIPATAEETAKARAAEELK